MAISLSATPLPEDAAVRLRLDAVAGYVTSVWDYSTSGLAANTASATEWVPTGNLSVRGEANRVRVSTANLAAFDGTSYVTRALTGLTVGQRYAVTLWLSNTGGTQVTVGRGATAVRSLISLNSAAPDAGAGPSAFSFDFVATATSEDLRLTMRADGSGNTLYLDALSVRQVPSARLAYIQSLAATDVANWSQVSTIPADATPTITARTTALPGGGSQYAVRAEYRITGGNPVQFPAGTIGIKRTVTGLTVGRKYRVVLRASATTYTTDVSTGQTSSSRLLVSAGVTGKGTGTATSADWATYTFTATATSHVVEARIASFSEVYATPAGETYVRIEQTMLYVEDLFANLSDPYSLTSLIRSDSNGVRPVRLYEGQRISDGVLVTIDPEVALTGLVTYTGQVWDSATSTTTTVTASTNLTGLISRSRIAPASVPSLGTWFDLATSLSLGRSTTSQVDQVINRDDPLVTLGSQTTRSGTLTIFADDYEMGSRLEGVFNAREVVLLRQPDYPGLDMYLVGTRTSLDLQEDRVALPGGQIGRRWLLTVEYTEVASPTTALRGSIGWTIAESLARNATIDASRAEFPTVLDLLIGPES